MDQSYIRFQDSYDDESYSRKDHQDKSVCDHLLDFERLRISALTKAAEISPYVKEVTIGPNSPIKNTDAEVKTEPSKEDDKHIRQPEENLIEDKLSEDLRYTLLMKRYDKQLQENTNQLFKDRIEKMIANLVEVMNSYWKKQSEECEQRALAQRQRQKMLILQSIRENDNLAILEKAKQDEQETEIIDTQTIENMNRILQEQNKATARFAAITDSHTKIYLCYNDLNTILTTEPHAKTAYEKYVSSIETVLKNMHSIMEICKTGTITDKEVKQSEMLTVYFDNIKTKLIEELNELKQQDIINKQNEIEAAKKKIEELEKKKAQELKAAEAATAAEATKAAKAVEATKAAEEMVKVEPVKQQRPLFYSLKNYSYYEELKHFLDNYENQYQELVENTNFKKFRFDCQKAVNTPVNALSSVSGSHIRDKFDKLSKLLKGEKVQVLDTYVTATQHPQGLFFCTALLAKKIVRQGDLLVSSNPEAAFPLAAVTAALWSQFPIFGKLLEANFHQQCPYLVPMFLPQKEGQTDKEFYISRGYTYNDEGVVEKQDKFLKRMSGIFSLRCAIWITNTPRFLNSSNPSGLCFGWTWLASFINLKPEPDICATLLHNFFSVCGSELFKYYRKQFTKVIKLISTEYLGILQNIDEGGPKTRLEVFLQNVLKTGHIPPPNGLLPPNTW